MQELNAVQKLSMRVSLLAALMNSGTNLSIEENLLDISFSCRDSTCLISDDTT